MLSPKHLKRFYDDVKLYRLIFAASLRKVPFSRLRISYTAGMRWGLKQLSLHSTTE
jgi:hypothetical protein